MVALGGLLEKVPPSYTVAKNYVIASRHAIVI